MLNAENSFIIRGLRILCLASLVGDRWWTWSPDESQVDTFRPSYMSTQIFNSDIQTLLYINSDILLRYSDPPICQLRYSRLYI